jgi:hypothetical protein
MKSHSTHRISTGNIGILWAGATIDCFKDKSSVSGYISEDLEEFLKEDLFV